eukprot:s714_g6.t1
MTLDSPGAASSRPGPRCLGASLLSIDARGYAWHANARCEPDNGLCLSPAGREGAALLCVAQQFLAEVSASQVHNRMLQLGDTARGRLGYGQHRLVFVGSDGRALGAPSLLPEANYSRLACFSHADMWFAWAFAVIWSLGCADACIRREFGGVYTIVNQASGRRLIADERGFYTTPEVSVSSTSMWHVLEDANATHVLQNVVTGARVYAQQGADGERGFYILDGDTPVFRDQRWQIDCRARLGGCTILDGPGGLSATAVSMDAPAGAVWWFMRQDADELGQHLAGTCELVRELEAKSKQIFTLQSQLDEASDRPHAAESRARETLMRPDLGILALCIVMVTLLLVTVAAMRSWNNPEFHHQTVHVQVNGVPGRLVRVCCPGVHHQDIEVKLLPNGCHIALSRPAMRGLKEARWEKTLQFDFREGFFEFVEDQMQLELGYLTLLFRETHYQDRTIRFAQHFSMDAFDHELLWDSPGSPVPKGTSPAKGHGDEPGSSPKRGRPGHRLGTLSFSSEPAPPSLRTVTGYSRQDADIQANQDAELGRDGAGSHYLGNAQVEDPDMRSPDRNRAWHTFSFDRGSEALEGCQWGGSIPTEDPYYPGDYLNHSNFHFSHLARILCSAICLQAGELFNSPCSVRWLQNAMGSFKDKLLAAATIGGVVAVGMVFSSNPMLKAKAIDLTHFMRGNPILGVVLHSAFSTAITVSGIPFSLVDLGAAWVYGFRAAMCMLLFAKTLGSICCFLVARSVLPAARKASVLSHPTVARVDRILASSPIYYGTLFRLALLPAFVKNYGLALLNIRFSHYLTCCLLGSCLGVPAQAYLGSQLGDIYLGLREAESVDPVILWGGIAPVLFLVILMPTIAKVLLGKDEPEASAEAKKSE